MRLGATPWLGTVSLDSAALDVVEVMEGRHRASTTRPSVSIRRRWPGASPFHQLGAAVAPFLAVCSSRRRDSCDQARAFSAQAVRLGTRARVLPVDLSHREINERLGEEPGYTADVESFLGGLDGSFRSRPRRCPEIASFQDEWSSGSACGRWPWRARPASRGRPPGWPRSAFAITRPVDNGAL